MSAVHDDPHAGRFTLKEEGGTAIAEYLREGDSYVFTHTEVPEALSGRGIGSRLVQGALDRVRAEGGTVVAQCSFVRAFIERHPEYRGLL